MNYKKTSIGLIPENWDVLNISDVATKVTDYVANGSFASLAENVTYYNEPNYAVLIRLKDFNSEFDTKKFVYVDKHAYDFLEKSRLFGGEIIISNVGDVGTVFKCPDLGMPMTLGPNSITVEFKGCNSFYYHWLCSDKGQKSLQSIVTGSAQPKFNKTNFKELKVPVPPLDTQKRIALLLDTIDLKIQNNKNLINSLFEQSDVIFNNFYSNDDSNLILFKENASFGKLIMGQSPKGDSYNAEGQGLPLLNGAADYTNMILTPNKYTTSPTKISKKGDLIFCIRATIGLLIYGDKNYCLGRGVAAITDTEDIYTEYVYHIINMSVERLKATAAGSVILGISKDDILNLKVKNPSKEQLESFHNVQKPIFDLISKKRMENAELAILKNAVLSKAMSGELDTSAIKIDEE